MSMVTTMPQEGSFQRTIPLHTNPPTNGQHQQPLPMDGVSNTGTNSGQQPMEITNSAPQDSGATINGTNTTAPPQSQTKLSQNVFVHKLYNMLEDSSISHLISWSSTNDSFVITPNHDFAKACSTYFKHTNISSFVRQLNMYGFHKVSDVFHNGSPESPLWEFRHREGAFRRGDFARLSAVKRRASRQALPHRSSFSAVPRGIQQQHSQQSQQQQQQQQQHQHRQTQQQLPQQQPLPPAPVPIPEIVQDPLEMRLTQLENHIHEAHMQLARTNDTNANLTAKCQQLSDNLTKVYQYNYDITRVLIALISDPNQPMYRDTIAMQDDIGRQLDTIRRIENGHPAEAPGPFHRPSAVQSHLENGPPMSPFQLAQDEPRRGSLFSRPQFSRPPMPQRATTEASSRRLEPMTNGAGRMSPPHRPALLDPMEPRIPPISEMASADPSQSGSHLSPPAFLRRHTFADIRPQPQQWHSSEHLHPPGHNSIQPGQQQHASPFTSGNSSAHYPSSPLRNGVPVGEQQTLQDSLARYQMPAPQLPSGPRRSNTPPQHSTPITLPAINGMTDSHGSLAPPLSNGPQTNGSNTSFSQNSSFTNGSQSSSTMWGPPRLPFKDVFASSDPPTRRSSMAHLLNPADTAERSDEDDVGPDDLRKRKRVQ